MRRLEREGMIERWSLPEDRRVTMSKLTPKGLGIRDSVITAAAQLASEFDGILGARDSAEMTRMLDTIIEYYRSRKKTIDGGGL